MCVEHANIRTNAVGFLGYHCKDKDCELKHKLAWHKITVIVVIILIAIILILALSKTEIRKDNNDQLEQQNYSQHSINDSKRKKLMNVLEDLVQLRKKLDNK